MKKLSTLFFAFLAMPAIFLTSCDDSSKEDAAEAGCCQAVNADSLISRWDDAWNTKDLEALKEMIADSAFVMDHEWHTQGKDSILTLWIVPSLPGISNLETAPLKINSSCCCVSMTGLYSLDYASKEGVRKAKGNFTFTWMLQEDGTYKLETMHLTEFHEKGNNP